MPLDIRKLDENNIAINPIQVNCNQETTFNLLNKLDFQAVGEKGEEVEVIMFPRTNIRRKKDRERT